MTTFSQRAGLTILTVALLQGAAEAAEVRGRILGDGGKPVARALVLLIPDGPTSAAPRKASRAETGEDGGFVAQGLNGGPFRVRVEAKGYAPLTQPGIPAGASVQLRLRRGVTLSGIVRDRAARTPIAGATVFAWEKDAEPFGEDAYRKSKSGNDGRFVVQDLPAGKVTAEAKAAGRAPTKTGNIMLPKTELELLLDPAGGVSGLVTDTLGDPVAGAEVTASWRGEAGAKSRRVKTGEDGRYRIGDSGTTPLTRMSVRAPKFLLAEREGPAGSDGVADFVLEHGGSIVGTVRGFDGKVPPTFRVKVRVELPNSSKTKSDQEFTDAGGAFRLDDLDPGTYTVEIVADRYASATKSDLDVAAEQVADAGSLTLQSRSVLRGRVVAARDRAPLPGVTVQVALVDGPEPLGGTALTAETSWTATSAADGTFATPTLPEGTFDVVLEHPQFAPARRRLSFQPDADASELVFEMYRGGALTGTVVDAKLEPVPGVRIVATQGTEDESRVADTGSDGRYFIDSLTPGTWTVIRQQEQQVSSSSADKKLAEIREGETTTVDFDQKPRVLVSGLVMKGEAPIPGASIYFVAIDSNLPHDGRSTQSDGEGAFQVGLLHGGRYQVSVVFGGSPTTNGHNVMTLTIPDQPEVRQDIVFNLFAISGHVFDPERKGVKGALVTAVREGAAPGDAPRQATSMTLEDGTFRLEAVDPGSYRVTARAKAYASAEAFPVVVDDNAPEPDLELTLQRGWIMRGRLVDPQGGGVSGALVVVAPHGASESGYLPSQTDASGSFRITAPTDGPVNVAAIAQRFAPAVQTDVEQPSGGGPSDVLLRATAGGSLRVRVVHRGGAPVAGVQVAFQPVPLFPGSDVVVERNRPRPTEADGTTLVTLLYPGGYVVSIPGRRDTTPVQVGVNEGQESVALLEVP